MEERPLTIDDVDFDEPDQVARHYEEVDRRGQQHVNDAIDELKARGEIDENGERTKNELPPDMRDDSNCDL